MENSWSTKHASMSCSAATHCARHKLHPDIILDSYPLFRRKTNLVRVTLIHETRIPSGQLRSYRHEAMIERIDECLAELAESRRGVIVIGNVGVSLDHELNGSTHWTPHAGLIVGGAPRDAIQSVLKGKFKFSYSRLPAMMKHDDDLARAWRCTTGHGRWAYLDQKGRQAWRDLPLATDHSTEFDSWMLDKSVEQLIVFGM